MKKLEMKNCNAISIEKLQNISIIIMQIDKYEYLTGNVLLPSGPSQMIEQAKFMYSPLGKAFEKQTKTI